MRILDVSIFWHIMGSSLSKSVEIESDEEAILRKARQFKKQNGLDGRTRFHNEQVAEWEKSDQYFAIIGSSKSGKSSFVKAIAG